MQEMEAEQNDLDDLEKEMLLAKKGANCSRIWVF